MKIEELNNLKILLDQEKALRSSLKILQLQIVQLKEKTIILSSHERSNIKLKWAMKTSLDNLPFTQLHDLAEVLPGGVTWFDLVQNAKLVRISTWWKVHHWILLHKSTYIVIYHSPSNPHVACTIGIVDLRHVSKIDEDTVDDVILRFRQYWCARRIQRYVRNVWFWIPRYASGRPGLEARRGFAGQN